MEELYPLRLLMNHAYAVVDRVAVSDFSDDWPLLPLVPDGFEKEMHLLPALLPLRDMSSRQQTQLLDALERTHAQGEPLPVTTFLRTDADIDQMRMHWTRRLIIRLPEGGRALLRSYDPQVFMQLRRILQSAQLKTLFGPVSSWTVYWNRQWQTIEAPPCDEADWIRLSAHQSAQLARVGIVNQVLSGLCEEQRINCDAASRQVDALAARAAARGILREHEQIAFALHGMTVHPDFDRHPLVAELLSNIDPNEQTYCDATALLEAAQWQRIAQELTSQTDTTTP